jgi:hypothetical protein
VGTADEETTILVRPVGTSISSSAAAFSSIKKAFIGAAGAGSMFPELFPERRTSTRSVSFPTPAFAAAVLFSPPGMKIRRASGLHCA